MNFSLTNLKHYEEEAVEKLKALGQLSLMAYWTELSLKQKKKFLLQVQNLKESQFYRQREALALPFSKQKQIEPLEKVYYAGDKKTFEEGNELVRRGKCGCVILAGGQGSRLRMEGPKGCVPITLIRKKSLFQRIFERAKAVSRQVKCTLPLAILTSPLNHEETLNFFSAHDFFGYDTGAIRFFCQKMWPLLDFEGNLFLEDKMTIAEGPNGNGTFFREFVSSGIWQEWESKTIEWVNVIPVDNPLAAPFDYELFGFCHRRGCDIGVKAAKKKNPLEKVGLLALINKKPSVIEYFEIDEKEKTARIDGELKYSIANLGLYCFSMPFILRASSSQLPLHRVKKATRKLNVIGEAHYPEEPNAWKFEEFIFDAFSFSRQTEILLYPKEECFAPLKNLKGEDSIDSVQASLLAYDRKLFENVAGCKPPEDAIFELASEFEYPTLEEQRKWRGKTLPSHTYIEISEAS